MVQSKVNCYGVMMFVKCCYYAQREGVDVSITGNSTSSSTRFNIQLLVSYKECVEQGKIFSVASGGGTGRTLHPDNMAARSPLYGMFDTGTYAQ